MSKFEVLTAMAFAAFADAPVDVAVVEVGMGGRWDATNVVDAPVAVITPIGIDHTEYLGDTVAEIAAEKAGIIGAPRGELVPVDTVAIIGRQVPEAMEVLMAQAVKSDAAVAREDSEFAVPGRQVAIGGQVLQLQGLGGVYADIFLPLHGEHQAHNAVVALAAVEAFLGGGAGKLEEDAVRAGLAETSSPGRLEVVRRSPTVLVDAAHNPAGATALSDAVTESFSFDHVVGVIGVMADKDARGIFEALEPVLNEVVITVSTSPRALDPDDLGAVAADVFGIDRIEVVPLLPDALERAITLAEESGAELGAAGVLVTGSVVIAGEARALLRGRAPVV
jgi:dihydrofolate synthase/folylpolyglutamate synthase